MGEEKRVDMTALLAYEAGLEDATMSRWQPIESAPRDGTWQVVSHFDDRCFYWWHRARFFKGQWRTGSGVVCPSHWMPLPQHPAAVDARARREKEGEG